MSQKTIQAGINGFGRIGRLTLRASLLPHSPSSAHPPIRVVQINDPFLTPLQILTLLRTDSTHGSFPHPLSLSNNTLSITIPVANSIDENNKDQETNIDIILTHEKSPSEIKWSLSGATVVADCTGCFLTSASSQQHLSKYSNDKDSKVQRVVLSAPAKSPDVPLIVLGVNEDSYNGEEIVSNASCTTNCLAPLLKAVVSKFRLKMGLMTTVHAVTCNQALVDGGNKKSLRLGFSGMSNIVPSSTGAAEAVGKVLKEVKGKITGMSMRVPVLTGSVVDVCVVLEENVGLEAVVRAVRESEGEYLRVDDSDSLVSAGVVGERKSCVLDVGACMEIEGSGGEKMIKLVAWYDNEFGYSCRLAEMCGMVGGKVE